MIDFFSLALIGASVLTTSVLITSWKHKHPRQNVYPYEFALHYHDGQLVGPLEPGSYRFHRERDEVRRLDKRLQYQTLNGQEMLSADRAQVRISLVIAFQGMDPQKALHEIQDWQSALHFELQLALREVVQSQSLDALLAEPSTQAAAVMEKAQSRIAALGFNLDSVRVRDVMLPGDLKRAYAQVLRVQKESQAALEKARGEQAALRSLANAARMLENNPALMNLRLLHTLENAPAGHTVVFQPLTEQPPS